MKKTIQILMMIAMVSCSKQQSTNNAAMDTAPSLKISVLKNGVILTNGISTTIPELGQALVDLKKAGGTVWYYREAGQQERHLRRWKSSS